MSALDIRRQVRRQRRRLTVVATVLAFAGLITVHHAGLPMDPHHGMAASSVIEMCLAVFTAVGAAVAAAGFAALAPGGWRRVPAMPRAAALPARRVPLARARHGPGLLSLLCVSRR